MKRNLLLIVFAITVFTLKSHSQATTSAIDLKSSRAMYQNILKTIQNEIKNNYFDPKLGGIDFEGNAKKASDLINEAKSVEEMADIIARLLYPFNDSHLYFIPPSKTTKVEYGWEMKFVGDKALIVKIDEKSDAYKKGVRLGDQIYMVNDYIMKRDEFALFQYHFNILRPQRALDVLLIKPSGNKYKLSLQSKVTVDSVFLPSTRDLVLESETYYQESTRQIFNDKIPGLAVWKMPNFDLSPVKLEKMVDKVKKSSALILDLRGNPGGYAAAMAMLVGHLFNEEIKIGTRRDREGAKTMVVKPNGKNGYQGKIVVLIDSESASAAEYFARIMQLEKRATVLGDQSMGALTAARVFSHEFGLDTKIPYQIVIPVFDLTMKDGKRLEGVGVTPDEKILPTATDLANKRDPVIARAAEILGFKLTPEQAGAVLDEAK